MSADDVVYVAVSSKNSRLYYHTDPDCQYLESARNVRELPTTATVHRLQERQECRTCAGTTKDRGPTGPCLASKLAKLDPDDVTANTGGESA